MVRIVAVLNEFINTSITGGTPYAKIASRDLVRRIQDGYRMPKPDKCTEEM